MGSVDIADQLRSVYTSHLPSRRTWLPLFFWCLDTAVSNSYLILKDLMPERSNKHKELALTVAWDLVEVYGQERSIGVPSNQNSVNASGGSGVHSKRSRGSNPGGYVTKQSKDDPPMMCKDPHHFVDRVSHDARATCYQCRRMGKKVKTPFYCTNCGLFLCIEHNRNCFLGLHSETLGKKN